MPEISYIWGVFRLRYRTGPYGGERLCPVFVLIAMNVLSEEGDP
jgi:hypothetical protein